MTRRRSASDILFAAAIAAVLLAGAFGLRLCVLRLPREQRTAASLSSMLAAFPPPAQRPGAAAATQP